MNKSSLYLYPYMARTKDNSKIDLIYSATLDLVLKQGYADLTMAEVAKQAGIATGTLYIYFKNKEELINQLFTKLKTEKMAMILAEFDENAPFYLSFQKLYDTYFDLSLKETQKMLFIEQYTHSPLLTKETKIETDKLLDPLIAFLMKGQKEHLIKNYAPRLMLFQIMGGVIEIVKYHIEYDLVPNADIKNECFEMAWRSIRK
jgi:TetR/AcrR family transcriptional regulator, repressor of fatR-cypB operon